MSGARIALPRVSYSITPAETSVGVGEQRVLAVGIMGSGSETAGDLVENIGNDGSEVSLFGYSQLSEMIRNFKKINQVTAIDAIGIAAPTGSAAESTYTVTGTATEAGEINIYIGGEDYPVNVVAESGDTANDFASSIAAAVTAIDASTPLPVDASASSGVVTFTAKADGAQGNTIGIRIDTKDAAPGLTGTLTPMTGGAGTPTLTGLFDVIENTRYQTIIWPFPTNTDTVTDLLEARWNVTNNILDGQAVTVLQDTLANALTELDGHNEKSLTLFNNGVIDTESYQGGMIFEAPENIAAQFCAFRALRYTDDSPLTQYITTSASLDQFGGPGIAALPYFNTLMPYLPTIPKGYGYTEIEVRQLNAAGGSVMGNNPTGTDVIIGEVYTTYKTDPAGNEDVSFRFMNYTDEQSIAREYFWANTRARYAQSRLTAGALLNGRDMVNELSVRTFLSGLWGDLSSAEYAILAAGDAYLEFFKDELDVTLDLAEGTITIAAKLCYVTQAREFIGTLQVVFDINS